MKNVCCPNEENLVAEVCSDYIVIKYQGETVSCIEMDANGLNTYLYKSGAKEPSEIYNHGNYYLG